MVISKINGVVYVIDTNNKKIIAQFMSVITALEYCLMVESVNS